ncbi:glycosyltransferase involved in cell wall biosynthesis [Rhizobium petrolearium]|uniref:glycosyltransferase family 4 protein n=1 Tax=Neorhizobium petrolearium TaxID=515361 RepID=UPI001AE99FA8|nr:glycosyltransferase family 1 protein [Neorhizobium petrolearium]MBP1843464.1 glycosyltransferase involved in cell wall biosynthesis [Neorhizobium petrolearium]
MNAIVMDISRLVEREHYSTPTGIDRYALHYANWLNERRKRGADTRLPQSLWFIETGYRGAIPVGTNRADRLISTVNRRWATTELSPSQAALLEQIFAAIDGKSAWHAAKEETPASRVSLERLRKNARLIAGSLFDRPAVPGNTSLIHVSHSRLDWTSAFSWLQEPGRKGIFYVHDLIPLSHPEYVRPHEPRRHRHRMETVLNHAALVLCNSQLTARDLYTFAQEENLRLPSIAVLPPGVEESFMNAPQDVPRPLTPYFVVVGTIEPRKNHMLLLHLWQYLAERDGSRAPRLVIVGKRGWENSQILAMLERCRALPGLVIEVPGLGDAALARLLGGAAALLSPSFVEGYGMPVTEALALHIPVIASNIPSHREAAGNGAILLDPLDGRSWRAAIDAVVASPRRLSTPSAIHRWETHFSDLEALIENDVATRRYAAQRMPQRAFAMPNNVMS